MSNTKIAVFQGSFDPFTRGHESIVQRALTIFDQVVVLVVHNSLKQGYSSRWEPAALCAVCARCRTTSMK